MLMEIFNHGVEIYSKGRLRIMNEQKNYYAGNVIPFTCLRKRDST